jgi:hypothetical protein
LLVPGDALLERWHDFYIVAGSAAATLVGLLFVGLSLHLEAVLARSEVRGLARVTLANFGLMLFVSLFLLMPQDPSATGPFLVVAGFFTLAVATPSLVAAVRSRTRTLGGAQLAARFGASFLAYVGVVVAGVILRNGSVTSALDWLVVVTPVLLAVSLRNSWDLLVSVGTGTHAADDDASEAPPGRVSSAEEA